MKQVARMMRAVGAVTMVTALFAAPAHALTVPVNSKALVVADQETTVAGTLDQAGLPTTRTGALIKINPIGSVNPGVQTVVAPDGLGLLPGGNFFSAPTSVVQREDQIYDVADENALQSSGCAELAPCDTGGIIEVDLSTGKQTLLASGTTDDGYKLVNPTALVVDPATSDIYFLDRSAGTDHRGAIFRIHENVLGGRTVTMVHDGGCNPNPATNGCDPDSASAWRMNKPLGMDIDAQGRLVVADLNAYPPGQIPWFNGTIFRVDPNAAPVDATRPETTPREHIAYDTNPNPNYDPDNVHSYLLDPQSVIVRPDGYYVIDSKDNLPDSVGGIIRIDPSNTDPATNQTFVAGGFSVAPPKWNFFAGGLYGIAPVDADWTPGSPKSPNLYALDADYIDPQDGLGSGMVGVVDPTNTDYAGNQIAFGGPPPTSPFSFNHTFNNLVGRFTEPRGLVTVRDMPDPPTISVNTCPANNGCGTDNDAAGAKVIEPSDGITGQGKCGNEGDPSCEIAFKVRLSGAWKRTVKVNYAIAAQTASDGDNGPGNPPLWHADFANPGSGTLTFVPGVTVQTVTVPVLADVHDEPDETLKLTLSGALNGTVDPSATRSSAIGTIQDNDNPPKISTVSPDPLSEDSQSPFVCKINLDAPSGKDIAINWATADGTALAGADYVAASGAVTIPRGNTSTVITASMVADALDEEDEGFVFNLSSLVDPLTANLPAGTKCNATILDNDDPPRITIKDVKSNEGNSGQRQVTLSAALSGASGKKITVNWATKDDVATLADKDYVQDSGTLTFQPGQTSQSIVVKLVGDTKKEQDEPFKVLLGGATNATVQTGTANVLIVNDDADAVTPGGGVKEEPSTPGGKPTKVCSSRRSFHIRVKKTKLRQAKVTSASIYVNGKRVTVRKGKRLTAPVVLKGLKRGTYRVVIKAKLSDGRTVTDVRVYHTCYSQSESQKFKK